jgi:hypothetical protein
VWQWCSTREVLLSFLIPVALASLASYLLPQAPAYLHTDQLRYQEWLSARQIEFKTWTPLLTAIGAFHIRETLWFRVLLTLLAFVLLIALGDQARLLLRPATVRRHPSFYDSADAVSLASNLPYEQAVHQVRQVLQHAHVRTEEPSSTYLCTDRRAWARAGSAVIYLGLLVLAGGLAIQARGGWRQTGIRVLPYKDVVLGQDSGLQLRLLDIQPAPRNGDSQPAPIANLQIAGQTVLPIHLGVPTRYRGYRFLWVSKGGPSVRLRAHRVSDTERPLTLYDYTVRPQPAQSLQFSFASGQDADRQFILSEDKIVGWLQWDEKGSADEDNPTFYLWLFGVDGQELGVETFAQAESDGGPAALQATIGDTAYRLEVARYIVLDIARQPGQWVLWLGGTLLALGVIGRLVPRTSIWAHVSAENDRVVVRVRQQTQGQLKLRGARHNGPIAQLRHTLDTCDSPE